VETGLRTNLAPAVLAHPIFDSVRPWLERAGVSPTLDDLNALSDERGLKTESGRPIRFVPPSASDPYYEVQLHETGRVQTRPGNNHDLFNALAWLAFPKTKACINALHAAHIPLEGGKRGRTRDMLTIFDEGGAILVCEPDVQELVRDGHWRELFVERYRNLRIVVVGHAVMEIFADASRDLDAQAAHWLGNVGKSPRDLPPVPVFGYPGWLPQSGLPEFYSNARYFRAPSRDRMSAGVGQAAAVSVCSTRGAEESPGSIERDAG
jgi:Protein of unknown function (DUF3025)